jgi:hypothetical protein
MEKEGAVEQKPTFSRREWVAGISRPDEGLRLDPA